VQEGKIFGYFISNSEMLKSEVNNSPESRARDR